MPPPLERRLVLRLILADGSDSVVCRTVEMAEGEPVYVGRASKDPSKYMTSADCNFHIPNSVVSRSHAQFTYHHGGANYPHEYKLFVEDLGSSHGTFLNERHLSPHVISEVSYGDSIRFGTRVIRTDAEFPPPVYNVEFTEVEDEGTNHIIGRSYSVPSDLDIPGYPYESDEESVDSAESVISINSDSDKGTMPPAVSMSAPQIDPQEQEGQILDSMPVGSGYFQFVPGPDSLSPGSISPHDPSLLWSEAEPVATSQLSSSQPLSPELSHITPHHFQPVAEPETPMSSKTKMISLQEILNQDSWPTPQTPTTDRKRKFDSITSELEAFIEPDEYSDEEEDVRDLEEERIQQLSNNNNDQITANLVTEPLAEEVSKIAQGLKEPEEPAMVVSQDAQPVSIVEPPRKRQRLSNIAVGVSAFIAGSVSTVAALASLPDNFFS